MTVLVAVETLVLVLLAVLVAGLYRSHAEILRRLGPPGEEGGAPPGDAGGERFAPGLAAPPERRAVAVAADLEGATPHGDAIRVGLAPGGPATLIAFLTSGCLTCQAFWEAFASPQPPPIPGGARLVIATKDGSHESPARLRELAPAAFPVVMSSAAWRDYAVPTAPYFVYVDGATGRVHGEGAASGWQQVSSLLRDALEDVEVAAADGGRPRSGSRRRALRVDAELASAGIGPGHPSLYPNGGPEGPAR